MSIKKPIIKVTKEYKCCGGKGRDVWGVGRDIWGTGRDVWGKYCKELDKAVNK